MLAVLFKHDWSTLTGITLAGLLLAIQVDASSTDYGVQASNGAVGMASSENFAYGRAVSVSQIFAFAKPDALPLDAFPLDSSDGTYTIALSDPMAGTRHVLQESHFGSLFEGLQSSSADMYGLNASFLANTPANLRSSAVAIPPPANNMISANVSSWPLKSSISFAPVKTAATWLGKAVPRPAALILLGTGLLGLAFGIRRITTRENSDNRNFPIERGLTVDAQIEINDPENEPADPVLPLFHQSASGQRDSISLSQSS